MTLTRKLWGKCTLREPKERPAVQTFACTSMAFHCMAALPFVEGHKRTPH